MVEPFLKILEKLVNDFSWRRLVVFMMLVSFLVAAVTTFELLTGYFRLNRLEKEVDLLEKLYKTQAKQRVPTQDLARIHDSLVEEMESLTAGKNGYQVNPRILQGMASLFPWILLSLGFLPDFKKNEKEATKSLIGILFIAVVAAAVGACLSPRIGPLWRYVVYPASTIALLIMVGLIGKWRDSVQKRRLLKEAPLPVHSLPQICIKGDPREGELRRRIREVLLQMSLEGPKGNRHIIVNFSTTNPEVSVPPYLREEYPTGMCVILQHEFWDLDVGADIFSVTLSFGGKRERLSVPFSSIAYFSSPEDGLELTFLPEPSASQSGYLQGEAANPALNRTADAAG